MKKSLLLVSLAAMVAAMPCHGSALKKAAWAMVPYMKNQALIHAAKNGDVVGVKKAIKAKANVNAKDKHGLTAMFYAARKGYVEEVSLLIDAGVNVNDEIIEKGFDIKNTGLVFRITTALAEAARNGHSEIVQLLINAGVDVNATFGDNNIKAGYLKNRTALTYAVKNHHDAVVKLLLDAGALFYSHKGMYSNSMSK